MLEREKYVEKGNEVAAGGPAVQDTASAGHGQIGQRAEAWGESSLFKRDDGSPMTPKELREAADDAEAFAAGVDNNRSTGDQDPSYLAEGQRTIDRYRRQAAAFRQEADRLVAALPELPSGSISNPDGTTTKIERLHDGTRRETTLDADGNVTSSDVVERLPGDWARIDHDTES